MGETELDIFNFQNNEPFDRPSSNQFIVKEDEPISMLKQDLEDQQPQSIGPVLGDLHIQRTSHRHNNRNNQYLQESQSMPIKSQFSLPNKRNVKEEQNNLDFQCAEEDEDIDAKKHPHEIVAAQHQRNTQNHTYTCAPHNNKLIKLQQRDDVLMKVTGFDTQNSQEFSKPQSQDEG